jgi:hypothetical protein
MKNTAQVIFSQLIRRIKLIFFRIPLPWWEEVAVQFIEPGE